MEKRKLNFKDSLRTQAGFTLMEVMIAISIFTIFATVFITGQGYNLLDSSKLKEELIMKDLAENKINDIIVNPPDLRESLTLSKETKEVEGFPDYQTIVEYKKFFVPDMAKIMGDESEGKEKEENAQAQMEKRIFNVFKENMEKMIWQVEVTVKNKTNDSRFKLSTWLFNSNADVQIGQF
ncbi:MAG: prepilin-type N-terminal cleavage/methylation domain-containing protein [Bacteriovorax sp.]|jgi:prepilin-type N-terminal cleavage/methylation domain-containing protein|nr:prepilin-type N-terminal cleavage/methylation domain-containing protein [Bacteriovorax sp.]